MVEELSPSYATDLLQRQEALQHDAHTLLTELDLLRILAPAGMVVPIGSYALGLMVWRDIDILVASPGLVAEQAFAALQPALAHPRIAQARYLNKSDLFNATGQRHDARYFFGLRYRLDDGADWNVDVSFWLDDSLRHEIADLTTITQRLTPDTRLSILWIKDIWHRLPSYHGAEPGGRMVSSRDIYDAVLQHGARTPGDFDAYLRARNTPARAEQDGISAGRRRAGR